LWDLENPNAIFTFSSTTDYVADICWSPNNSTVFASVSGPTSLSGLRCPGAMSADGHAVVIAPCSGHRRRPR
jgi:hypothetical protein